MTMTPGGTTTDTGTPGTPETRESPVRPRAVLAGMRPYVPGRTAEEVRRAYGLSDIPVVKMASNENPFGPSPRAVEAAARALGEVSRYPDGAAIALRDRLAALFGLARENVTVGNGSDEVILLLALAYLEPGTEAVLAAPPYAIHHKAVLTAGGRPVAVALDDDTHDLPAMANAVGERTRVMFVTNPHNPTGTAVTAAALEELAARVPPRVLLIVDEAYHDFVDDDARHNGRDLLDRYPNVVTLRTFSKAYGLAGLRAGYALAHRDVVETLDRIRPPFGLNSVAQAAALAALDDEEHVARVVAATRQGRARLLDIAHRHGLRAIPSQTNFVLMRPSPLLSSAPVTPESPATPAAAPAPDDSGPLVEGLLRRGVIVRPGENLGMPGWIRVSVGTAEDLDRFEQVLAETLDE